MAVTFNSALVVLTTVTVFTSILAESASLAVPPAGGALHSDVAADTLIQAHVLFRHGSRAPVRGYPGDPNNNETFWFAGYGQLTEEGLRQHFALGRWFRHRYNGVLPPRFDSKRLVVRSTDVDRTLNSAGANLAGIFSDYYNSHPKQQFQEGLPWQPTPIHTVLETQDKLLAVGAACPELQRLEEQLLNEPFVVDYTRRLQPLIRTLTARLGVNFSSIVDVGMVYDSFNIQRSYKLPLPGWVLPLMPQLEEVQRFSFFLLAPTPALRRLRAGPLLAKIVQDFHEKQTLQTPDFLMYSAHDTNVAEMLQAFDLYTDVKPPFASALLFELHHMHDDFFVRLYYHNDTSLMSSLQPLTLPGCNFTCSLADFETLLDSVILRDFESECQRQSDEQIRTLPQLKAAIKGPSDALFENANGALLNTTVTNQSIENVTTNPSNDVKFGGIQENSTSPFDAANESQDFALEVANKSTKFLVKAVNENQDISLDGTNMNRNASIEGVSENQSVSSNATNISPIGDVSENQSLSVNESNIATIDYVSENQSLSLNESNSAKIGDVSETKNYSSNETNKNLAVTIENARHDESTFHDESAPHDESVFSYDPTPKALVMALIPLVFICCFYILYRMVSGICKLWTRYRNRRDYAELF